MAQELRFTDPAFTCEVILSGPAKALYEIAQPQFERLKGIRSLGLVSHTTDLAIHNRHAHLVGLMRIFNKLGQQPAGKGLPKKFLWSFWTRLVLSQVGHAALSYDSEKAVLLACHLDSVFKEKFRRLFDPVINQLSVCNVCNRDCESKIKDSAAGPQWFENIVQKNQWTKVHHWITAVKIIQEPRISTILKQQVISKNNLIGYSDSESLKILVCPECGWDESLLKLDRLDYVVRDLAFAGTLGIQVDVDGLIASANEPYSDWELIGYLNRYLTTTLYESNEAQTTSTLYQRTLAHLLISNKVSLEDLFGLSARPVMTDSHLISEITKRSKISKTVFDLQLKQSWQLWPISCYIKDGQIPCEVEKSVTKQKQHHLISHSRQKVTCIKLEQPHSIGLAMYYIDQANRPEAKTFIRIVRNALIKFYPQLDSDDLTTALYEGLIARNCQHRLHESIKYLAKLPIPLKTLQDAAIVVNRKASVPSIGPGGITLGIGGRNYPLGQNDVAVNIMHAAFMGDDTLRRNLEITLEEAAGMLWLQILQWQSIYFGLKPTKSLITLIDTAKKSLLNIVSQNNEDSPIALELYTMLEALHCPDNNVIFRISLPNVILLKEDKTPENEYDVVSVVLKKGGEVEVWIWGVTTEKDITRKKNDDRAKIQKFKDLLGDRWSGDIETVENYVYKDANNIKWEIHGRQGQNSIS